MFKVKEFFFTGTKTSTWQNVHQEFESTDGGGWFSSGDYYMHTFTAKWLYLFGLPIWRLSYETNREFYEAENAYEPIIPT